MSTTLSSPAETTEGQTSPVWLSEQPIFDQPSGLPGWYTDSQAAAWSEFQTLAEPTRTNQNWRFADLKKARFAELSPAEPPADVDALVARAKQNRLDEFSAHFVFANNRLIHSETGDLPEGAICLPINEALAQHPDLVQKYYLKEDQSLGGDKLKALLASATLSGIFVYLPKGTVIEKPILTHQYSGGEMTTTFPHTIVVAEDNASVSLLDKFRSIGEGEQTVVIGNVDIFAENGAKVQYVAYQNVSDSGAKHVQFNSSKAGRDASIKTAFVNLGAAWVRNESVNHMAGTGSDCQIFGAALANGIQEYDQRTLQIHEAEHTTSDLLFKNALYDEARTIFSGLIQVKPGSHHTDSFQTCRNLLGSDKAEANSMPGLEIDADQVKCSHGSTSGQISDEEIFYLQARGIPAEDARKMISLGFLYESVSRLDGDELKEFLFAEIERKFASIA